MRRERLKQLRGLDPDQLDHLQVRAFPSEEPWGRVRLQALPWVQVQLREEVEWALPWGLPRMAWVHRVNLDQVMVMSREGKDKRVLAERGRVPVWEEVRKEKGMEREEDQHRECREREEDRERREREEDPDQLDHLQVRAFPSEEPWEREQDRVHQHQEEDQHQQRESEHPQVLLWGQKGNG